MELRLDCTSWAQRLAKRSDAEVADNRRVASPGRSTKLTTSRFNSHPNKRHSLQASFSCLVTPAIRASHLSKCRAGRECHAGGPSGCEAWN